MSYDVCHIDAGDKKLYYRKFWEEGGEKKGAVCVHKLCMTSGWIPSVSDHKGQKCVVFFLQKVGPMYSKEE